MDLSDPSPSRRPDAIAKPRGFTTSDAGHLIPCSKVLSDVHRSADEARSDVHVLTQLSVHNRHSADDSRESSCDHVCFHAFPIHRKSAIGITAGGPRCGVTVRSNTVKVEKGSPFSIEATPPLDRLPDRKVVGHMTHRKAPLVVSEEAHLKAEISSDRGPTVLDRSPLIRPNPNIYNRGTNKLKELLDSKPNNRKISSVPGFHPHSVTSSAGSARYSNLRDTAICRRQPEVRSLPQHAVHQVEPTTKLLKSEYGDYIRTTRCVNTPKTGSITARNPNLSPLRPLWDDERSGSQDNEIFRDKSVSTVKNGSEKVLSEDSISGRIGAFDESERMNRSQSDSNALKLHIDATRGIAGDMLLAALIDLGVAPEVIFGPLQESGIFPEFRAEVTTVERRSIEARAVKIEALEADPPHRGPIEISKIIDKLQLPERAALTASRTFELLARAESEVHGVPIDQIHFHEVGALDSLVDIVGVCLAIDHLQPLEISCSSLPLGSGTVRTAHGTIPIPAPATMKLLEGLPTHPFEVGREVTTPTGAALAKVLADRFGESPSGCWVDSGWGAGTQIAPPEDPPNLLRVWTTRSPSSTEDRTGHPFESVVLLESNLDTASGEDAGSWIEALLAQGALDAWIVPTIAKKGRPGLVLSVLGHQENAASLRRSVFQLTGTLGVRQRLQEREILDREIFEIEVSGHPIRVKRAWHEGVLLSERPEYEDLLALSRASERPLREIRDEVEAQLAELRRGNR